jgi:hypothetical protein
MATRATAAHKQDQRGEEAAGAMDGVRHQGLGMQDDAFTRPGGHDRIEALDQSRHVLDGLDQGIEILPQPRLGPRFSYIDSADGPGCIVRVSDRIGLCRLR